MTGPVTRRIIQRLYSGCGARCAYGAARPASASLALALACGGCSMSGQLDSLFGRATTDTTGSITPPPAPRSGLPPETDLAFTRAAASDVLSRGDKDSSQPWENPHTGARGTVTPLATAYTGRRPDLPRFPGELCQRPRRSPGCRAKPASSRRAAGKFARSSRGSGRKAPMPARRVASGAGGTPH